MAKCRLNFTHHFECGGPLALFLAAVLALDIPPLPSADTTQARWLADLDPATVRSGTVGRWVFVPGSRASSSGRHFVHPGAKRG